MVRKKHISLQQNNKDRNNMDIVALTIIAIMSIISGIAAIAVLIDMYNTHKTKTA
jgi:undecaprenyl pyrophosphate phosphatase UppP